MRQHIIEQLAEETTITFRPVADLGQRQLCGSQPNSQIA
jgi:hypothetical protein